MSRKTNAYVAGAADALSLTVADPLEPIAEPLLNDVQTDALGAVEVTDRGQYVVIAQVTIGDQQAARPVADANGNVRLYSDGAAVVALAKKTSLVGGADIRIIKKPTTASVGNPIAALKSQHRAAATESVAASKPAAAIVQSIAAATSLGWNTAAAGSPEREEFEDLERRQATIDEWLDRTNARVASLAAALTAAGIDPVTYLPMPGP